MLLVLLQRQGMGRTAQYKVNENRFLPPKLRGSAKKARRRNGRYFGLRRVSLCVYVEVLIRYPLFLVRTERAVYVFLFLVKKKRVDWAFN